MTLVGFIVPNVECFLPSSSSSHKYSVQSRILQIPPTWKQPQQTLFLRTYSSSSLLTASNENVMDTTNIDENDDEETRKFKYLMKIAQTLKLEIFDLEEGIYGYDCKDQQYGLEVIQTSIDLNAGSDGLGLVLDEMASSSDGRGLVLISDVTGNAAKADPPIQIGDAITGIKAGPKFRERVTGSNYDVTVDVIGIAKDIALGPDGDGIISLELNRVVKRAKIVVEVDDGNQVTRIDALAGENLRRLLMRKGIQLYDKETKRFDMPFASGDCAGEGLCGTCLVAVTEGGELLGDISDVEKMIMKGRPLSWRASCRTVVGANNQAGTIKLSTHPQSRFADELNPGVRSIDI